MTRSANSLAVCAFTALALLSGCATEPGGISSGDANRIEKALSEAKDQFDEGACTDLESTVSDLDDAVAGLSDKVDGRVRTVLADGVEALAGQMNECKEPTPTTETLTEPPPTTTAIEPPPTATEKPPKTKPEKPPPTETTETTETQPETDTEQVEPNLPPGQVGKPPKPGKPPKGFGAEEEE